MLFRSKLPPPPRRWKRFRLPWWKHLPLTSRRRPPHRLKRNHPQRTLALRQLRLRWSNPPRRQLNPSRPLRAPPNPPRRRRLLKPANPLAQRHPPNPKPQAPSRPPGRISTGVLEHLAVLHHEVDEPLSSNLVAHRSRVVGFWLCVPPCTQKRRAVAVSGIYLDLVPLPLGAAATS